MGGYSEKAAAAAIRLTKDERFLYISVRERDLLAVIDVSHDKAAVIQLASCEGKHPRDFILSKNEKQKVKIFHKETHLLEQEYTVSNKIQQAVRDFSI